MEARTAKNFLKMTKRVLIIGGVAGGASCAARLRRLDESAEIVLLERGPHVSFANCGLPYRLGGVIQTDEALLVTTPELLRSRFAIDVRTRHEVGIIDRERREVRGVNLDTQEEFVERYDSLVLSPGAVPVRPPLPGIDLEGIFTLRNIPDLERMRAWIVQRSAHKAVVVGGGFIGLETAENLKHLGLSVTVVEMLDQVMPPMDPEMTRPLEEHMRCHGLTLALGDGVAGFERKADGGLRVLTKGGVAHDADVVLLAIGVKPDNALAKATGLAIGERGGIRVDERMRTSDPAIYAVGDAVEVRDAILGQWTLLALAGPANRQGRVAADNITGRESHFRGVIGTSVCGVFDMAVASTGASEKALKRAGRSDYTVIRLHPAHHVGYYPGAEKLHIKAIFENGSRRLLGAQIAGREDVARKADVFATFLQMGGTADDLAEAELAYAPQFGSAKDAVNLAGMIAQNVLDGSSPLFANHDATAQILDVREPDELRVEGRHPTAINIPLGQLRSRVGELARERTVAVYCESGKRAYDAQRLLRQRGYDARQITGGWISLKDSVSPGESV